MGGDSKSAKKKKFVPSAVDKKRAALVSLSKQMETVVVADEVHQETSAEPDSSQDRRKLAKKLAALNLSTDPIVPDKGCLINIRPVGGRWEFSGTCDNSTYLSSLMLRVVVTGELYVNPIVVESYDEKLSRRCAPGSYVKPGYSRYKPSAYKPMDPMFVPRKVGLFMPLEPHFLMKREDFVFSMTFHRSLIRLLDMLIVMREVFALQSFGTDWFKDTTDGVHAAGLVDFEHSKGNSIFNFHCAAPHGSSDLSVRLTGKAPYIGLYGEEVPPDDTAGMVFPAGYMGECFVHPVLDFYIQRDYATMPYQYGYVQDSVFTHTFLARPLENKGFGVKGNSIAADLIRSQWKKWVCLVSGSFVWANYVTIHLESYLYTHAPFAVWRAMELLVRCLGDEEFDIVVPSVLLADWKGEEFFQFPYGNSLK